MFLKGRQRFSMPDAGCGRSSKKLCCGLRGPCSRETHIPGSRPGYATPPGALRSSSANSSHSVRIRRASASWAASKCRQERIQLLEAGEDAAGSLQPAEAALDFVAPFVGRIPMTQCDWTWVGQQGSGQVRYELAGFPIFAGPLQHEVAAPRQGNPT